ncbi:metal ABC transporter permease [Candidatus Paracaedibacter symbiosus]|uniref:metal ABC transporter permease n=1 Tax=Candidatus Paracaedibacter symbiosus TaxID=244582 RepID=UPI00068D6CF9|nr:metal ABC transporter permease [Candidatus Paracaedibacter symbiosus]
MVDFFLYDFMGRALLAAMGMGFISAVMGCFLVWRRMAFFGDAMAHAAVLGVALGVILEVNTYLFIAVICLMTAVIIGAAQQRSSIPIDTWLAAISYTSLALGIILIAKTKGIRIDPEAILFGDILSVSRQDLAWIYGVVVVVWGFILVRWQPLLLLTLDEELAVTAGVNVTSMRLAFTICLAIVTAVGIKASGALLLPALMILPAASMARFARSPEVMVAGATVISLLSVTLGILGSFHFDTPSGPTIIVTACGFFLLSSMLRRS